MKDIYDIALIVSGDQDYVPAVQVAKDAGKRVVNVAFKTRSGALLPGGARRLNQAADWSVEVSYDECRSYLCLNQRVAAPVAVPVGGGGSTQSR